MKHTPSRPDATDEETALWLENADPEDFDIVIEGRAAQALVDARVAKRKAEAVEAEAVKQARAQGLTWEQISYSLGMTRQGAYQKYASLVA